MSKNETADQRVTLALNEPALCPGAAMQCSQGGKRDARGSKTRNKSPSLSELEQAQKPAQPAGALAAKSPPRKRDRSVDVVCLRRRRKEMGWPAPGERTSGRRGRQAGRQAAAKPDRPAVAAPPHDACEQSMLAFDVASRTARGPTPIAPLHART
jgi:hypothetical protein